jgi:hypothetical protein
VDGPEEVILDLNQVIYLPVFFPELLLQTLRVD